MMTQLTRLFQEINVQRTAYSWPTKVIAVAQTAVLTDQSPQWISTFRLKACKIEDEQNEYPLIEQEPDLTAKTEEQTKDIY